MKDIRRLCDGLRRIFEIESWEFELSEKDANDGISIWIDMRYRRFGVTVYKDFWEWDRREQAEAVVHEFCHFFNLPVKNLIDRMRDGRQVTEDHTTDIMEFCNCHAQQVIYRILKSNDFKNVIREYERAGEKGRGNSGKEGVRSRRG